MPTQKDFKRVVRRRMQKTGESYTAARAQLLESDPAKKVRSNGAAKNGVPIQAKAAAAPSANPADYAKLAGMSDAAIEAKTGCSWKKWVDALDYKKAWTWSHREIAEYVHENFEISGWWAQCVTVGYERIRGLRDIGQRRGGSYEASKSKTFPVPVRKVYEVCTVARLRSRWLPKTKLTVRGAQPDKSVRITWHDGTSVEVWLTAKGANKCSAALAHRKLPDKAAAEKMKAFWAERLEALADLLTP